MHRSELLILIVLLLGLCQQYTNGYRSCGRTRNGAFDVEIPCLTPPPPAQLPPCLTRAQSTIIPIVGIFDFRTEIKYDIVPPYVESYTIVQQKLVNVILTARLIDRASMDELIRKVKTASASLAAKLGETMTASERILTRVNDALQRSVASESVGEQVMREQQKCMNEVGTELTDARRLLETARNGQNREYPSLGEAKQMVHSAQDEYDHCFSLWTCSNKRESLANATVALYEAQSRVAHRNNLVKQVQEQKTTLQGHIKNQRARLTGLQNAVSELKQKQMTISKTNSQLRQIIQHLSGLNSASATVETVMKDLGELAKLIMPLNNIYNEMLTHHLIQPFEENLITHDTLQQFKASVNQLKKKAQAIDIYMHDDHDHSKDSTYDDESNKDDKIENNNNSNNRNTVQTDDQSDDADKVEMDESNYIDKVGKLENDTEWIIDNKFLNYNEWNLKYDVKNGDQSDDTDNVANDDSDNSDTVGNDDESTTEATDKVETDDSDNSDTVENNDESTTEATDNSDKVENDEESTTDDTDKVESDVFENSDKVENGDESSTDDKVENDESEISVKVQNEDKSSNNNHVGNDDQLDDTDKVGNHDEWNPEDKLENDNTGSDRVTTHSQFNACRSGNYDVPSTWCSEAIPTASDIVVIPTNFTVTICARSKPQFFRMDIHGILRVHIDSPFPPAHSFTLNIFDGGLLTDTERIVGKGQTTWRFPSNSILFIHRGGQIRTQIPVIICNRNSSVCTGAFHQSNGPFTVVLSHLGQIGLFQDTILVAVQTGNVTTAATWCGGQVPTADFCKKNGKCSLLILPDVKLSVGSAAEQDLFSNIEKIYLRGQLNVNVPKGETFAFDGNISK